MLSREQVEHIANLSRIGLDNKDKDRFAKDLAAILSFIDKLKEVDIEGVEPMAQATGLRSVTRVDEGFKRNEQSRARLLANAPESKDGDIKVKTVFE